MTVTKKRTRRPRTTYIFGLSLNVEEVLRYHFGNTSHEEGDESIETPILEFGDGDIGTTDLIDLMHERTNQSKRSTYFLDIYKNTVKYWINMIDVTQNGSLPRYTTKPCWWCRHQFATHPIGCPIRYCPETEDVLYKSRVENALSSSNLPLDEGNDFFETEGLFCSFPCVKSYIIDCLARTKSSVYQNALTLLTLLYQKLYGVVITIPRAPTWKVLVDFGGHLTISEFRQTFGQLDYRETPNIRRPYMYSSSRYIQETKIRCI